jgi:alkylhydroperoxidase/carboxymuconolactone decarboxylase family protein YurZ
VYFLGAPDIDFDLLLQVFGPSNVPAEENLELPYTSMVGRVPPRVRSRLAITGALDPQILLMQEKIRNHALSPRCFDEKTVQLFVFAILLGQLNDAALVHGRAARKAGASWEELQAVIGLCYLFRGVSGANRGAEILARIAMEEAENALNIQAEGR